MANDQPQEEQGPRPGEAPAPQTDSRTNADPDKPLFRTPKRDHALREGDYDKRRRDN